MADTVVRETGTDTGMELRDLLDDPEFAARTGRKRDYDQPFEALRRLTQVFYERPQDVLQELVNIAVLAAERTVPASALRNRTRPASQPFDGSPSRAASNRIWGQNPEVLQSLRNLP